MRTLPPLSGIPVLLSFVLFFPFSSFGHQIPVGAQVPEYNDKQAPPPDQVHKPESVAAAVDSSKYQVGAADILRVDVWDEPKFSADKVVVQQNGKITMPLIGDIQAGDNTPKQIEAQVAKALTQFLKKPLVTVTVLEVGSKKYYLDGEVNHPGEYPLSVPTTVLEAISKSGGLQEFANRKKIYVLRSGKKIPFNYKDVISGKNMDQNIPLEPGDHIYVP